MKAKLFLLFFLVNFILFSQEFPPIIKYSSFVYGAGNQSWMISQDNQNYLYFANNDGLLEYNGTNWQLYPAPNETIIRSVKVIDNKIYTGCYMNFGYWTRQSNGKLKYTSLSDTIKSKILDDEQFWNILKYDQWILFQSLNRIYIYDTKSKVFKIIAPKNGIVKSFNTKSSIYFQTLKEGLFEIESGKAKLVSDNPILKKFTIANIFTIDEGLLIQTQLDGFYKLSGNVLTPFTTDVDSELKSSFVYSSQRLQDGSYALGTVSNGIYILTDLGKLKYHISQSKGLSNNTALSLFEDKDQNLWIGLDNGINCINIQSSVHSFTDDTGVLGTIYASATFNGMLYVGTNQGLFCKKEQSNSEFRFIKGTKGQVWSLFVFDGELFCGHDTGTFTVINDTAKNIFSSSGTWKFESFPGAKNLLIQGNYYGISVLEKRNNQWEFRNKIKGFDYSARYFEFSNNELYVSHEYKGVFRLKLDKALLKTNGYYAYSSPSKGKNASLTKFNNVIYYAFKGGIFKLNKKTKEFEKDEFLSSVFEKDEYTSGKLIVDDSNKIWLFSKNYIHYFSASKLSNQLKENVIPIPSSLTNSMLGFENITQISKSTYLIGTTDGYYTLNIDDLSFKNYSVLISEITANKLNQIPENAKLIHEGSFKSDKNNITFSYTVPEYNKYINSEYQYLLEGFQDEWSEWSTKAVVSFKNLPPGKYTFKVKAKYANTILQNTAVYTFVILKPWYLTHFAWLVYFLLMVIIAYFINKTYRNFYQKQKEKLIEENNLLLEIKELENEQELMRVRNEQLSQDVDTKNRELAVSTMSLNSKNELLSFIKEDLKKTTHDGGDKNIKSVISTINKNITEEDSWKIFKEAFDNADKDFLKRIKQFHPLLTSNDLRLCAYLRLNLSSKEIAPLFNISVRSVEIKRYRLRKKMDLQHENGLVEYILSV